MDIDLVSLVYHVFPYLALLYVLGTYVVAWPTSRPVLWLLGLAIAGGLVVVATVGMRAALPSIVPTSRLVAAYVSLYVVPMIALLLALATLAPRLPSRWLGALALIAIYLVVSFAARYLSGHFFDLVEASG
jgi:hypothetical protein